MNFIYKLIEKCRGRPVDQIEEIFLEFLVAGLIAIPLFPILFPIWIYMNVAEHPPFQWRDECDNRFNFF